MHAANAPGLGVDGGVSPRVVKGQASSLPGHDAHSRTRIKWAGNRPWLSQCPQEALSYLGRLSLDFSDDSDSDMSLTPRTCRTGALKGCRDPGGLACPADRTRRHSRGSPEPTSDMARDGKGPAVPGTRTEPGSAPSDPVGGKASATPVSSQAAYPTTALAASGPFLVLDKATAVPSKATGGWKGASQGAGPLGGNDDGYKAAWGPHLVEVKARRPGNTLADCDETGVAAGPSDYTNGVAKGIADGGKRREGGQGSGVDTRDPSGGSHLEARRSTTAQELADRAQRRTVTPTASPRSASPQVLRISQVVNNPSQRANALMGPPTGFPFKGTPMLPARMHRLPSHAQVLKGANEGYGTKRREGQENVWMLARAASSLHVSHLAGGEAEVRTADGGVVAAAANSEQSGVPVSAASGEEIDPDMMKRISQLGDLADELLQ